MTYLSQFIFPSADAEERFLHSIRETCFTSFYPFQILTEHEVHIVNFDEPENSLSVERQLELVKFIEVSVRFFGCQFIIATHSPFLLSMKNAKIYNLDESPMRVSEWTTLPNVRTYYDFFKSHEGEFS